VTFIVRVRGAARKSLAWFTKSLESGSGGTVTVVPRLNYPHRFHSVVQAAAHFDWAVRS
jgi:hypothetical protein